MAPPLFLDQNEAPGPKKIFLRPGLPYLPYTPPPFCQGHPTTVFYKIQIMFEEAPIAQKFL